MDDAPGPPASREAHELYLLPPDRFIQARDRLARELKGAGRTDDAARIKKLRRPSIVAWAVNVTARERREDVEALLEAGANLRRAQRATLSGRGGEELRRTTEARRIVIQRLTDAAIGTIGTRGEAHRDAIAETLDAASIDDVLGERLRAGTLEREARPPAGFGAIEGFEMLIGGAGESDPERSPAAPPEEARERAKEARAAERRAAMAERAAEKAAQKAADLKEEAAAVASAAREAEVDAKRLADEARTERKRADRAARAMDRR